MSVQVLAPLREGCAIALVDPAGTFPERFRKHADHIREYLHNQGFIIKDYVVNSPDSVDARVDAFHRAFDDNEVSAVLPLCGGQRIYELLPRLDYKRIGAHPKIVCGSSELSALVVAIYEQSGFVTFFGPHLSFLNPKASKAENAFSVRSFWNMLRWDWHGKNGLDVHERFHVFTAPRSVSERPVLRNIYAEPERIRKERWRDNHYATTDRTRRVHGELLVASLPSIVRLCELGMPPQILGKIVVLETLDMGLQTIKELIHRLNELCSLRAATGIALSSFAERTDRPRTLFPELRDQVQVERFLEKVANIVDGVPLFHGLPVGHCAYKFTIPIGVTATIEGSTGTIILEGSPYNTPF